MILHDFMQSHKTITVHTSLLADEELLVTRIEKCSVQPFLCVLGKSFFVEPEKTTREGPGLFVI